MAGRPNPYTDPGPWGRVRIGARFVPGYVTSIDGAERPEQWDVQKATEKTGAQTIWKGTGIADSIKLVVSLATEEQVDDYYALRDALRPQQEGKAPPVLPIVSPVINFAKITRVSCRNVSPPTWVQSGGYWEGRIELIDYAPPKPASTGAARPGAGGAGSGGFEDRPDPNAALRAQRDGVLNTAKFLRSGGRVPQEGN